MSILIFNNIGIVPTLWRTEQLHVYKGFPIIPILRKNNPIFLLTTMYLRSIFSSNICLGLSRGILPVWLPVKSLKSFVSYLFVAIYHAHFNLLGLITLAVIGERCKL